MKEAKDIEPNYGPVYAAAMYPDMANIFQRRGYALAVHGSLRRDFDLIGVPWTANAASPEVVLKDLKSEFSTIHYDEGPTLREHGRMCYMLHVGFGVCSIDLSFMPRVEGS